MFFLGGVYENHRPPRAINLPYALMLLIFFKILLCIPQNGGFSHSFFVASCETRFQGCLNRTGVDLEASPTL